MNERMRTLVIRETLDRINLRDDTKAVASTVSSASVPNIVKPRAGYGIVSIIGDNVYKTTTPQYLYNLPFGYPRYVDIGELRRLGKSPYVQICIRTIINELCSVKWEIVPRDEEKTAPDAHIKEVEEFFDNPNDNDESWEQVQRKFIEDLLILDASVLYKVFSLSGKFSEVYAIDGGSINRNPNIHGNMAGRLDIVSPFVDQSLLQDSEDNDATSENREVGYNMMLQNLPNPPAYFQYGYANAARPVPLGRREIVYMMMNPNTNTHYGFSPMESLMDTVNMLIYGITHNLEYYTKDYTPKGILQQIGMTQDECEAFSKKLQEMMTYKDVTGNNVKKQYHLPVLGFDGKFVRTQFTNQELEMISQQEWFTKLVWAAYGVTPSELGFTADSNRATEIVQSEVFRRKTIRPMLNLIEYMINTQIVWSEFYDDVKFKFDMYDLKEDLVRHELYEVQLKNRIRTPNEVREEMGIDPIEGGDELKQATSPFGSNPFEEGNEEDNKKKYEDNVKEGKATNATEPMVMGAFERITPKKAEKEIEKILDLTRKRMVEKIKESVPKGDIIREIAFKKSKEPVEKAFGKETVRAIMNMLSMDKLKEMMSQLVRNEFSKGVEKAEKELSMNFMPSKEAMEFIRKHALDNVRDMAEETKNDIRSELERGIMANEGVNKLSERVKSVFDSTEARAKSIVRTETNRAMNVGHISSYKSAGVKGKKKWVSQLDDRTTEACKALDGQTVGIDENFKYKDWEGPHPPYTVNCRSRIVFEAE